MDNQAQALLNIETPKPRVLKIHEAKKKNDLSILKINLSNIKYIRQDVNMITLPFFYFSDKKKIDAIEYILDNDENKKILVQTAAGDSIPSTFDYEVFQVLLKFREARIKEGISKELWKVRDEKR